MMARLLGLVVVLLVVADSVLLVAPSDVAVVYRFGAVHRTVGSGMSMRLPWPIESDEQVAVREMRRLELEGRRMLSGDSNLVEVGLSVQYTIEDPVAYLTAVVDVEGHVGSVVEAAAFEHVAGKDIDTLLTTARSALENAVRTSAQQRLQAMGFGLRIDAVETRELAPPATVVEAFNDVSSARGDKETMVLSAESYASQQLPDVRGQASTLLEGAGGRAAETKAGAINDVARFKALLPEFRRAPEATRATLLRSALSKVPDGMKVIAVKPGTEVVLPMKP